MLFRQTFVKEIERYLELPHDRREGGQQSNSSFEYIKGGTKALLIRSLLPDQMAIKRVRGTKLRFQM